MSLERQLEVESNPQNITKGEKFRRTNESFKLKYKVQSKTQAQTQFQLLSADVPKYVLSDELTED